MEKLLLILISIALFSCQKDILIETETNLSLNDQVLALAEKYGGRKLC